MNSTPKYGGSLGRSHSPLRSNAKQRYYSAEEVNRIVRASFQPKIQYLVEQLQTRQQEIGRLNNQLHANDQKLIQQAQIIETYTRKQKEQHYQQHHLPSIVTQVVNEKLKQFGEAVSRQLKQIATETQNRYSHKQLQQRIQAEIEQLKGSTNELMENWKRKSNAYWQKIKDALGKISSKVSNSQKDIMDLTVKLDNITSERQQERKALAVLSNSRPLLSNLVQLKRSVDNIYSNYQAVLQLQRNLKQQVEEQAGDSIWIEGGLPRPHLGPSQSLVALEYSREERNVQEEWPSQNQGNSTQPIVSPLKTHPSHSPVGIFGIHKGVNNSHAVSDSSFSLNTSHNQLRSQNSTVLLNLSLDARKQMCQGVRQRLLELMQMKGLRRPLAVRYDQQINYLKSAQGNYLFDLKGNMFKVTLPLLTQLQGQGILTRELPSQVQRSKC